MVANIAMKRRAFLAQSAALVAILAVRPVHAVEQSPVIAELVRAYAGGAVVREGRVKFEISPLVENGNSVPVEISVESPMTLQQHVVGIAIFNEKNPQNDVAQFVLSPLAGRARAATRIRLATTQQLVAVAKMNDGTCWSQTVEVLVTVASCTEE
jgi:sulfur-oxidizing protein SoxY